MRRALTGLLAAALLLLPAAALAATPRTSLPDVEDAVMCPSCREPLALAQSVQADDERQYIRGLIAQGLTKSQILTALQAQYGAAVLAKPPAHGFDLTVYVVPPAAVLAGLRRSPGRCRGGGGAAPRGARRRAMTPRGGRPGAGRCGAARGRPGPLRRLSPVELCPGGGHNSTRHDYIESGALTPSSPSASAIVRCAATDSAIRNASSERGSTPTTLQSR